MGGTDGSIALDEVQVWSSVNGSCPPERECTFQSSLCSLETDPSADFPWVRINGMQAAGSASPSKDHTLGTDQGEKFNTNHSSATRQTVSICQVRASKHTED